MSANSKIEWTDHTFNPWIGCTKVSPGCDNCYAERREDLRLHRVQWGAGQPRKRTKTWGDPVRWDKQHAEFFAEHGRRQRVFCASLADVFDNEVDNDWRCDLFELIESTPNLDWLLLTKRIGNVKHQVWPRWMQTGFPANVWIGATIVDQAEADRDLRKLLALPALVHFVSYEPALGALDLRPYLRPQCDAGSVQHPAGGAVTCLRCDGARGSGGCPGLSWVIAGGESGPGARPAHPAWFKSLRDHCAAAAVPFLFKQWGEWLGQLQDGDPKLDPMTINAGDEPLRCGKKASGRLLDGRTHDGFPA